MAFAWAAAFGFALLGAKLWLIGSYANATPFWDQWDAEAFFLYQPFLEGRLDWSSLLAPHNEHHIFTTRLLDLALLQINGTWNPILQMVINAVLHVLAILLICLLAAPALGPERLPIVLVFALVLFAVPHDWECTLWGFESQFYLVLLFSAAGLWMTVESEPLSPRWAIGIGLSILAFLSFASGAFVPVASAAAGIVVYALGIRRGPRQLFSIGILLYLFILGFSLTPIVPGHHSSLRATTVAQFWDAFVEVTSWPFPPGAGAALFRSAPLVAFCIWIARKRPATGRGLWFLLSLALLGIAQAFGLAYGRASNSLSSRYTDLFSVDVLVNFAILLVLSRELTGARRIWAQIAAGLWATVVLCALIVHVGKPLQSQLQHKRDTGITQQRNLRNFLLTGDVGDLAGTSALDIPYPSPKRLARIVGSPHIRQILPSNLRAPLDPTSIDLDRARGFVLDGYPASTPRRAEKTIGSYGASGSEGKGQVAVRYDSNERSGILAVPVAGYPSREGMGIELDQDGRRTPLRVGSDPGDSWALAYVNVAALPFSLIVTDQSASSWIAIAPPVFVDALDLFLLQLLSHYGALLVAGVILALASSYATWRRASRESLATQEARPRWS